MSHECFSPGQTVAFRLKDAVCPRFGEAHAAIGPDLEVRGAIVFFSDGGAERQQYAIIEVSGIHTPLIVPVYCLEPSTEARRNLAESSESTPQRQVARAAAETPVRQAG